MTGEGDLCEGWVAGSAQTLNIVYEDDVAADRVATDRSQLCPQRDRRVARSSIRAGVSVEPEECRLRECLEDLRQNGRAVSLVHVNARDILEANPRQARKRRLELDRLDAIEIST